LNPPTPAIQTLPVSVNWCLAEG